MIHIGDCHEVLRTLESGSVQCCVTSPPYWGLRDYGVEGQLGLEKTPDEYVAKMVDVFREVRRVLRDDGTLWLNLGDSYAGGGTIGRNDTTPEALNRRAIKYGTGTGTGSLVGSHGVRSQVESLKPKDLVGIPWRVAFALQADGWYLRQDIIWHKPNPMPESVRDRCTKAHEYIFLMSKSERYFFDSEAMQESANRPEGPGNKTHRHSNEGIYVGGAAQKNIAKIGPRETRNRRSVWTVATQPYSGAHFATFPPALIEPCILAGSRPADIVLDPFMGSGTTAQVAQQLGRQYIGCELNPQYLSLQHERTAQQALMLEH